MGNECDVLVTIMNNQHDFSIARDKNWYRIPVKSADKWLSKVWPPKWIAFYQTKAFGKNEHSINYYAKIKSIRKVLGKDILPEIKDTNKQNKLYYQLFFEPLMYLPEPIFSRRWRRIVFIPTTMAKLKNAYEINDLYHGSPLEDKLWVELKRRKIQADRQEYIEVNKESYFLDFAIYCETGNIDIETDGDKWHQNPETAKEDNVRNNSLTSAGWDVLRFSSFQVTQEMITYCIPNIVNKIEALSGVKEGNDFVRRIDLELPASSFQYGLFDV